MGGFGLNGFFGRIPCPHCKSTDCMGISGDNLKCSDTNNIVNTKNLTESAIKHKMSRYDTIKIGKWELRTATFVNKKDKSIKKGEVVIWNEHHGVRGQFQDLATAKEFVNKNINNHSAYYEKKEN